ncbi:TIGR01440 family protein [Bifidobacterium boum]|uniref:TIGR01440 family protein n=1 Tax=Bifidobacterium boum TaxID=78343 RepID=UPI00242AA761|nr:TIGR01440 family protein [Bifidobacterium boum]MCI5862085.1 TIGR01440 family protein [Bifidobacterium boum]
MQTQDFEHIRQQTAQATREVLEAAHLSAGDIFVIGCSSSEVLGEQIGTHTSMDVAPYLFEGTQSVLKPAGIFLAAQCCEHLNRALVIEQECLEHYGFDQVNAIPQPNHAGGAFGTIAYQSFDHPVLVEDIQAKAKAGIDIGGTLIGMHIHPVVVPLRISIDMIGKTHIICARYRPKYIGGSRAIYDEKLM